MRPYPKPDKPWRSESYREFVRGFPCWECGVRGDDWITIAAHHAIDIGRGGTMGGKDDDRLLMPLCSTAGTRIGCHEMLHADTPKWRDRQIRWAMEMQDLAVEAGVLDEDMILNIGGE